MINKIFVERKISLIQEGLQRLQGLKECTFDEVAKDFFKYSTLKLVLMEVIGRAIDINEHLIAESEKVATETPSTYRETFLTMGELEILPKTFALQIAESAGFRNAVVHDYNNLDHHLVFESVGQAIRQYTQYCEYILNYPAIAEPETG